VCVCVCVCVCVFGTSVTPPPPERLNRLKCHVDQSNNALEDGGAHWHHLANTFEQLCAAAMRLYIKLLSPLVSVGKRSVRSSRQLHLAGRADDVLKHSSIGGRRRRENRSCFRMDHPAQCGCVSEGSCDCLYPAFDVPRTCFVPQAQPPYGTRGTRPVQLWRSRGPSVFGPATGCHFSPCTVGSLQCFHGPLS